MGNKVRISNVYPKSYQFIDLLSDATSKAMNDLPRNLNLLLHMKCGISRTTNFMDITDDIIDDKSVLDMFKLHDKDLVINLHVLHQDIIPRTKENIS